jgi:hypothetical protein
MAFRWKTNIISFANGGDFTSGSELYSTASLTAKVVDTDDNPVSGVPVTWSVDSAQNNSQAMVSGWGSKKTGLTWGDAPEAGLTIVQLSEERIGDRTSATGANGEVVMQLTDIVGERAITVRAKMTIDGTDYAVTEIVSFGNGPLSVFKAPVGTTYPYLTWDAAYKACNSANYSGNHSTGWEMDADVGGGKMPTRDEYQAVSGGGSNNSAAQGAVLAAGWPAGANDWYWTGEAYGANFAFGVYLGSGDYFRFSVGSKGSVACRR